MDRQEQWCKPCRRKKKCIRFIIGADGEAKEVPEKDQIDNDEDDSDENQSDDVDSKENLERELGEQGANYQSFTEQLQRSLSPPQFNTQMTHPQSTPSSRLSLNASSARDQSKQFEENHTHTVAPSKTYSSDKMTKNSKQAGNVKPNLKPSQGDASSSSTLSVTPDGPKSQKTFESTC